MLNDNSLEIAGLIEKDCRMIGVQMQRRRAKLRLIRQRNHLQREGMPINQKVQKRDVQTCVRLKKRIRAAMKEIHRHLREEEEGMNPSAIFSQRRSENVS